MKFSKYNSIENSYQEEFIQRVSEQGYSDVAYVVQEKVHGANISFITDGTSVMAAKRTEMLTNDEDFYNWKPVMDKYREQVLALWKEISGEYQAKTITVFGELFGGGYPHPDVPNDRSAKLIQRGIYYCPHNDFYAFDILIDNSHYLNVNQSNILFEKHGFIYAKTLYTGKLADCLNFPNQFPSAIYQNFDLPALPQNICEGVVIRPVNPLFLSNGTRVLIKNKNEKWAENNNAIDKKQLSQLTNNENAPLSEEAVYLCGEMLKLVTENRLQNLLSKIGNIDPKKDTGRLIGMFSKDVLEDFLKSHKKAYESLEKAEAKSINKLLNAEVGKLMMGKLLDNLS